MQAAVIGAGSFGTAIAHHIATMKSGESVVALIGRSIDQARAIEMTSRNPRCLSEVLLPRTITALTIGVDAEAYIETSSHIIIAVPTRGVRGALEHIASIRGSGAGVSLLGLAKGIEAGTNAFIHEIAAEVMPEASYTALSGPSHAEELVLGVPTAVVAASSDMAASLEWQRMLSDDRLRVYTSSDVIGTEAGGAMKNVAAIAAGIARSAGFGDNSIAALTTRALAEMMRLAAALGADPSTMAGLAGVGDLMVTCWSDLSRNFRFGHAIGSGMTADEAEASIGQAVEGKHTVRSLVAIARSCGVEMPVASAVESVVFGGVSVRTALTSLLSREPKPEMQRA